MFYEACFLQAQLFLGQFPQKRKNTANMQGIYQNTVMYFLYLLDSILRAIHEELTLKSTF